MAVGVTLALAAAAKLVASLAYARAGVHITKTHARRENRIALIAFGVFWFGLATTSATRGILEFASGSDLPLGFFIIGRHLTLALIASTLGGLAYYVLHVYTGRQTFAIAVAAYYAIVTGTAHWLIQHSTPIGLRVNDWTLDLLYAQPRPSATIAIVLALGGPAVIAAGAYLALMKRFEPGSTQRRRILLVGTALTVWLASALVARTADGDLAQFITRPLMGLTVATLVYIAYSPASPAAPKERPEEFTRRAHDLI